MRIWLAVLVGVCTAAGVARADEVHLKNNKVVEGKLLEKTADGVKIDIGGVTLTYYNDEIDSVTTGDQPVAAAASPAAIVREQVPASVPADDLASLNKDQLIRRFVQIYGVKENMQANFDQMIGSLQPEQAQAFRDAIKVDAIIEQLLPVYNKHFTEEDLRAYIRFYISAQGKKLVQSLPLLMKDSVDVSMKYLDAHLPESLKHPAPMEKEK